MEISDLHGIDISSWQAGIPASAINSVDFAILKISEGQNWVDPQFDTFYNEAKIPLGAYVYSHATTEGEAEAEAIHALHLAAGRKLPLGIYMDVEEQKQLALSDSRLTAVVKAFCDAIKAGGYRAGAYGSAGNLWAKVGPSYLGDDVIVWAASWGLKPKLSCDVWQYTDHARIDGYDGPVDGDEGLSERFLAMCGGTYKPEPVEIPAVETFTLEIPVLRKGDINNAVKAMQGELIALGYRCGGKRTICGHETADGIFGNVTEESVRSFQRSRNLPDTGVMDKTTRDALICKR